MSESSTAIVDVKDPAPKSSALERTVFGVLSRIPGFEGAGRSTRMATALRGGAWSVIGYGAGQIMRLASTVVLARMLAPTTFGLVALVNVFLSGLEMLSDLGVGMDVIQNRRGDDPVFINTAFLVQAVRGTGIWMIAVGIAYPFARFYHEPALFWLAVVSSISVFFRGINGTSLWTLARKVQLGKLTMLNFGSDFFGFIVAISWAVVSPTAWALVVGRVAAALVLMIASHWVAEYPVSLKWDRVAAREILAFGAGIFVSTSTYFIGGEAERLVIGKFVTLVELGCFSLALSLSSAIAKGLQQVVIQVFFPMMSDSLRNDQTRASKDYKKARYAVTGISACMAVTFVLGSKLLVKLVLGTKYAMAGWMLQLLGVRGSFELFMTVASSMLFAMGVSKYAAVGNVAKLIFLAIGLTVAFTRFGFHEALLVLTLAPLANYIPLAFGLGRRAASTLKLELTCFAAFTAVTISAALLAIATHN